VSCVFCILRQCYLVRAWHFRLIHKRHLLQPVLVIIRYLFATLEELKFELTEQQGTGISRPCCVQFAYRRTDSQKAEEMKDRDYQ